MRMLFSISDRVPAAAGGFCLILAMCLTGCASKNPLIDDAPAPTAGSAKPAAAPVKTAEAVPAPAPAPIASAAPAAATAEKGVQMSNSRFLGILRPYRIDVQQGNFVTREMVALLKPGMTPDQVRFVLGTPLLTDIFHNDRWDYVFRLQKGTGAVLSSHVVVFFKDNRMTRFVGGDLPTEEDYLALIAGFEPIKKKAENPEPHPAAPSSAAPTK